MVRAVSTAGGVPLVLARLVEGLSTHQCADGRLEDRRNCSQRGPGRLPSGRGPADGAHAASPPWIMSSTTVASRRTRWCPRSGRDGHVAAHIDQGALRQQVQRGIERMQAVVTRRAQPRPTTCTGRFGVAIVLHSTPLARTGGLSRAALVVMSAGACVPTSGPAGAFPFEFALICRASGFGPRRQHRPLHTAAGPPMRGTPVRASHVDVPGILSSAITGLSPCPWNRRNAARMSRRARPRGTFDGVRHRRAGRRKDAVPPK